jgi:hypothetical protein
MAAESCGPRACSRTTARGVRRDVIGRRDVREGQLVLDVCTGCTHARAHTDKWRDVIRRRDVTAAVMNGP